MDQEIVPFLIDVPRPSSARARIRYGTFVIMAGT
jgi:hypothetical protein